MAALSTRDTTKKMTPGTPLNLDWGSGRCRAEAIVVGSAHALVLSRQSLNPGTLLDLEIDATGEKARCSVAWCGSAESDGSCKLGLQVVEDDPEPGPDAAAH